MIQLLKGQLNKELFWEINNYQEIWKIKSHLLQKTY